MTPLKRAEKIARNHFHPDGSDREYDQLLADDITVQIKKAWKQGFLAARDKAVGIIKEDCEGVSDENCQCCACLHADRLREMKP